MTDIDALVIGDNRFQFHRFERIGPLLERALERAGITTECTTDRDRLLAENVRPYDVVVDCTTDSTFTEAQRSGLLSFVADGGGYAGVHGAAVLTTTPDGNREEPVPELRELIGGHFLGHPDPTAFDVNITYSHHPVSATLDDFRVWDEPYRLAYDDDVQVLARMDHPTVGDMPVAWVKAYGEGNVFYCSLGHDRPALTASGVQALLIAGVQWAADS